MRNELPEFSEEQWAFLAVLEAFSAPISIEIAGNLAPLRPGPLIDLLEEAERRGYIARIDAKTLAISDRLPADIRQKLCTINCAENISMMLDRLKAENLEKILDPFSRIHLLYRAGRVREAAEAEIDLARSCFEESHYEKGRAFLLNAVTRLEKGEGLEDQKLFIAGTLQLSDTSFTIGKGFIEIDKLLHKAHEVASQLGDKRSHALINLHLGRLYYFRDRREDALVALSLGAQEVDELNDRDIRSQCSSFLGIYSLIKGHLREAFEYFEEAEKAFIAGNGLSVENSLIPALSGYCATYLGRFHQAMGGLDLAYRLAMERSNTEMAAIIRAVLGTVLVLLRKKQAGFHLNQALEDARKTQNELGLYLCGGGIALRFFSEGSTGKAYEVLRQTYMEGHRAGLVRQFSSPWVLEMLFEFDRLGYDPIPGFEYASISKAIFEGVNIHLQGVAFRLRAKADLLQGVSPEPVAKLLDQSAENLRRAGDPVQLSKTLLEIAGLKSIQGRKEEARQIAREARHCLGGYFDEFFPREYKHLVEDQSIQPDHIDPTRVLFENYLEMIEAFYACDSRKEILETLLSRTSRMLGAERSALFWFPVENAPEPTALLHLSVKEVNSDNFKESLKVIMGVVKTKTALMEKLTLHESLLGKKLMRSILCIPVEVQNRILSVLYYDNSYLENAFEPLDLEALKLMARHTHLIIEQRFEYLKTLKKTQALTSIRSSRMESAEGAIVTRSPKMKRLLEQADNIARTDSTVLIQGETGTGKELLAYRIYQNSDRADGPFVVVDAASIPETLLESELFGHEKGAFTGADKRKIGFIEMAHKGTLFLDEVGELTLQAQAKILRALQEKTIRRVGGVQPIKSDFRLIAATNRDLLEEVRRSRFREDLYYRLNVIALTLPPLRERGEDAVYLAQHFVDLYAKRYNQDACELTPKQKTSIKKYGWPGNIRQLQNKIESAMILSTENGLVLEFPSDERAMPDNPFADRPTLDEIQRRYILYILDHTQGKISGHGGAADILGLKRTSLYSKMKSIGVKR